MRLMASLNAPFFHPYVQMEQGICRLPPNVLGLIIALRNPTSPSKLKIQRGNGPFHANEIEYVSQYNCENWAVLDWCLCRIEDPTESGFINVLLSTLWFVLFNGLADQTLVYMAESWWLEMFGPLWMKPRLWSFGEEYLNAMFDSVLSQYQTNL